MPSRHIQARLHSDKIREADALAVFDAFKQQNFSDREIVREALIALGEMHSEGWQPQQELDEVKLTSDILKAIRHMTQLAGKLATLDLSGVRSNDGNSVDHVALKQELTDFDRSASEMLGEAFYFNVEDDEE